MRAALTRSLLLPFPLVPPFPSAFSVLLLSRDFSTYDEVVRDVTATFSRLSLAIIDCEVRRAAVLPLPHCRHDRVSLPVPPPRGLPCRLA